MPIVLLLLLVATLVLYVEKRTYQMQNRELLIQNDSILSVNIELKKASIKKQHCKPSIDKMNSFSLRNILVPVDMSEAALCALDTAVTLATINGAGLYVLYVDDTTYDFADASLKGSSSTPSTDVLSAMLHIIESRAAIKPRLLVKSGAVAPAILKVALEYDCDLIAIGKCGASGFRPGFAGTNAYNVVKYAACPVLVVPPDSRTRFKHVVFPVRPVIGALARYDVVRHFLLPKSQLAIFGLSFRLKEKESGALLQLVHDIGGDLNDDSITTTTAWGSGESIADDVLEYCTQQNTDLVVVTHAMDVTLKACFLGAHAQQVINRSKVPVLCIGRNYRSHREHSRAEKAPKMLQAR